MRAVLARGLDPDPAQRWPDMDALLDALERARARPRRKIWAYVVPVVFAIALAVKVFAKREETPRAARACEPAEQVFAEAWSDAARGELSARAPDAVVDRVARGFEQFRTKWTKSYQEACNAPPSKAIDERLACLRGVRDQTVVLRYVLRDADERVLANLDMPGMLPNLAMCSGPSPVAPPLVPDDQPRRAHALAVLARAMTLRGLPADGLATAVDKLVAEAEATGWKHLAPIVRVTAGNIFLRRGDSATARALFRGAVKTADIRFQAMAHVGLLEASVRELEKPGYGEVRPKLGAVHEELARLFTYARSAVKAANDDPMLAGSLALLEAETKVDLALWGRSRPAYRAALLSITEARKEFEKAGDLQRAASVAAYEAHVLLWRASERSLDDALYVVRSAEEALTAAGLEHVSELDELRARIAFAKGEYADAHERFDRLPRETPAQQVTGKGRVVDKNGKPVQARVIAWRGALHGDPARVYTDPRFDGEIIETATDGTFEFHTGDALVAEHGPLRSAPRDAGSDVTLVVEETTGVVGRVEGNRPPLVDAVACYAIGHATFYVHAAIARDGAYRLDGLPRGGHVLGVLGPAGNGTRRTLGTKLVVAVGGGDRGDRAGGAARRPRRRGSFAGRSRRKHEVRSSGSRRRRRMSRRRASTPSAPMRPRRAARATSLVTATRS